MSLHGRKGTRQLRRQLPAVLSAPGAKSLEKREQPPDVAVNIARLASQNTDGHAQHQLGIVRCILLVPPVFGDHGRVRANGIFPSNAQIKLIILGRSKVGIESPSFIEYLSAK